MADLNVVFDEFPDIFDPLAGSDDEFVEDYDSDYYEDDEEIELEREADAAALRNEMIADR